MISVVVSVRNNAQQAANCLSSMARAFALVKAPVEFILVDDNSDPQQNIPQLLASFRQQIAAGSQGVKVTTLLFRQQQHYTRALAQAFSIARGGQVLFVSHDMLLTADYVRTLLAVAALDHSIGLVRGTSPYVDCFPEHRIIPPLPIRTFDELDSFARYVSEYHGLTWTEDRLLTGDSMLIKRAVFDRIGTFDPRYFGYFGDIDFGLRLQRAGFKMVCAKGAWLWHEGAGAYKDQAQSTGQDMSIIRQKRMEVVNAAYKAFRDKWDTTMPPDYHSAAALPLEALQRKPGPLPGDAVIGPVMPDPAVCQIV